MIECPICAKAVREVNINSHIDSGCAEHVEEAVGLEDNDNQPGKTVPSSKPFASFFAQPAVKLQQSRSGSPEKSEQTEPVSSTQRAIASTNNGGKRSFMEMESSQVPTGTAPSKKSKPNVFEKVAPLAERMRPKTLNDVCGQELVGSSGVLRGLIEQDRVPSMILWGGPGTGMF